MLEKGHPRRWKSRGDLPFSPVVGASDWHTLYLLFPLPAEGPPAFSLLQIDNLYLTFGSILKCASLRAALPAPSRLS